MVTTYNPHITFIAEIANRNWHFLQSKESLARIFQEPPLVAYRRPKNLRDILVSTKLKSKTTRANSTTGSCGPCSKPKCSWFSRINETFTFTGTQDSKVFDIFSYSELSIDVGDLYNRMQNLQITVCRKERDRL